MSLYNIIIYDGLDSIKEDYTPQNRYISSPNPDPNHTAMLDVYIEEWRVLLIQYF